MFEYNICNQADAELFYKQCLALEKHLQGLQVQEPIEDVDGTMVQRYDHSRGMIIVKNDMQVDALYVISEFDLLPYFEKEKSL